MRSLAIKLGLLLVAAAATLWMGWDGLHDPPAPLSSVSSPQLESASPLDLNRATTRELTTLPGIGEVIAKRIVEHRKINGFYTSVQQLLDVRGIGETRLARLRPLVSVPQDVSVEQAPVPEGGRGS